MNVDVPSKNFHILNTGNLGKHLARNETHLISVLGDAVAAIEECRAKARNIEVTVRDWTTRLTTKRAELEELEAFAEALKRGLAKRLVKLLVEDEPQDGGAA